MRLRDLRDRLDALEAENAKLRDRPCPCCGQKQDGHEKPVSAVEAPDPYYEALAKALKER